MVAISISLAFSQLVHRGEVETELAERMRFCGKPCGGTTFTAHAPHVYKSMYHLYNFAEVPMFGT
jgi:hypothetical protein